MPFSLGIGSFFRSMISLWAATSHFRRDSNMLMISLLYPVSAGKFQYGGTFVVSGQILQDSIEPADQFKTHAGIVVRTFPGANLFEQFAGVGIVPLPFRIGCAEPFTVRVIDEVGLSLIHISEPTRLGMISYAVFCL